MGVGTRGCRIRKWDLIVTMDDATNEHYAMAFVEEEGTRSSFPGIEAVIASMAS